MNADTSPACDAVLNAVVYGAWERWAAMSPPEWCPASQTHAVHRAECSSDWKTQDRPACGCGRWNAQDRLHCRGKILGGFDLKVLELDPGKRVLWQVVEGPAEWIGTKIGFDLKQEDDFSIVLFKHEGWKEPVEFMSHCSTKWAVFLLSLKSLVETGKGKPSPDDVQISNWH
jgi:hypothetical protein